ncbi:MAG TPA: RNA-directed DNA polymerase [Terrimicrobiaceae bacterium]
MRNCQDGQTNGIPVGPDTSLLIAELLLSHVDRALGRRRIKGMRYMDDYELVFVSEERALEARGQLQETLLDLELDLSLSKTSIQPLPQQLEESWVSSLSLFDLHEGQPYFNTQIVRFFDRAFDLARTFPKDGVLKYAAGRVARIQIRPEQVDLVETLLMQCAQVEAGALSIVLASMLKRPPTSASRKKQRHAMLLRLIEIHAAQRHSSEVAWSIWACIAMKLELPKAAVRAVIAMEDSVCALLALHARRLKLVKYPSELDSLRNVMSADSLYGHRWMLAYEANLKGWFRFKDNKDYVLKDQNFAQLKKANVSFYDESKTILPEPRLETARGKVVDDYLSRVTQGYGLPITTQQNRAKG